MLKINTDRLHILSLNQKNLELFINDYEEFERTFNFSVNNKKLSERQKNVWKIRLNSVNSDLQNYLWHTLWIIVLKESNNIIGTLMLKGYPNERERL